MDVVVLNSYENLFELGVLKETQALACIRGAANFSVIIKIDPIDKWVANMLALSNTAARWKLARK